jgi:hypothetical protein
MKLYALHNRIRLASSDGVIDAATLAFRRILELYFAPDATKEELYEIASNLKEDPLRIFSETYRVELAKLQHRA